MTEFFPFPHTPHLVWLGAEKTRSDKILSEPEKKDLLAHELVVEEKIDGANLGFSINLEGTLRIQNRGQHLAPPYVGQFKKLSNWLSSHEGLLFDSLDENLIVFGEWCAARHSLHYTALPDWWILFDVYDKRAGCFFSTVQRNIWAEKANVSVIHQIAKKRFDLNMLEDHILNAPSFYRQGSLEGIILRNENESRLTNRAKLVRPEFTQAIDEHWSRNSIEWNQLQITSFPGVPTEKGSS